MNKKQMKCALKECLNELENIDGDFKITSCIIFADSNLEKGYYRNIQAVNIKKGLNNGKE